MNNQLKGFLGKIADRFTDKQESTAPETSRDNGLDTIFWGTGTGDTFTFESGTVDTYVVDTSPEDVAGLVRPQTVDTLLNFNVHEGDKIVAADTTVLGGTAPKRAVVLTAAEWEAESSAIKQDDGSIDYFAVNGFFRPIALAIDELTGVNIVEAAAIDPTADDNLEEGVKFNDRSFTNEDSLYLVIFHNFLWPDETPEQTAPVINYGPDFIELGGAINDKAGVVGMLEDQGFQVIDDILNQQDEVKALYLDVLTN